MTISVSSVYRADEEEFPHQLGESLKVFQASGFIRIFRIPPDMFSYSFELAFLLELNDDLAMVKLLGS